MTSYLVKHTDNLSVH